MATALARSIALPPPMATTTPGEAARHASVALSARSGEGSGVALSYSVTRASPMDSSTRERTPRSLRPCRPVTRNTRALGPATSSMASASLESWPGPKMTLVGFSHVNDGNVFSNTSMPPVRLAQLYHHWPEGRVPLGMPGETGPGSSGFLTKASSKAPR